MRKFILTTAIVLMSATANAGPLTRSLSLASTEPPLAAEQPNPKQTADAPTAAVERPKLASPQEQEKAPVVADKPEVTAKPKTKRVSTETRIIYELHRHGIYW
jgi:hypothetical protein